jgi:hypothetical protein
MKLGTRVEGVAYIHDKEQEQDQTRGTRVIGVDM